MKKSSKAFNKAVMITNQNPPPKDVFEQLEQLRFQIEIWEHDRFGMLYEGLTLDESVEMPVIDE